VPACVKVTLCAKTEFAFPPSLAGRTVVSPIEKPAPDAALVQDATVEKRKNAMANRFI
jgi:hypothetical protein